LIFRDTYWPIKEWNFIKIKEFMYVFAKKAVAVRSDIDFYTSGAKCKDADQPFKPCTNEGRYEIKELSIHAKVAFSIIHNGAKVEIVKPRTTYFEEIASLLINECKINPYFNSTIERESCRIKGTSLSI
jgi:hypothetical protein